jgi:hypothetical protein
MCGEEGRLMRLTTCLVLMGGLLPSCLCFQPVDERDGSVAFDAGTDAGRDAGSQGGLDGGRDGGSDAGFVGDAGADGGSCVTACCQCDLGPPRACPPAAEVCAAVPMISVGRVASISAPVNGVVTVTFVGGVSYALDVSTPLGDIRRRILENLRSSARPAAVEVDCTTNRVVSAHSPFDPSPVVRFEPTTDGFELLITTSAARLTVNRARPCFEQLVATLAAAVDAGSRVIVTDRQPTATEVIDVRPPF